MKKMLRFFLLMTAVLLAAALTASAVSAPVLGRVYSAGKNLLFSTDNVTLNGTADFMLDGVRFKGVKAKYMQDGYNSYWDYKLLTPRLEEAGDRETGYTIIANEDYIYTIDAFYPGSYREGYDNPPQNTLVRTSALMDQVVDLAGAAVGCMEPLLGGDAVQVIADNHTGTTVHIVLNGENITDLTNAAFNMCAQMVIRRLIEPMDYDYIRSGYGGLYDYMTLTKGILALTHRYDLRGADVTATIDGSGRLRAVSGSVKVELTMDEGLVLANETQPHVIDLSFNVTASDYNSTRVSAFDPEAEGLKPQYVLYSEY